jgi:hypothetical protein
MIEAALEMSPFNQEPEMATKNKAAKKIPTAKKVAKVVKAVKAAKKLCAECKERPPRTPRALRCFKCQKEVRKEQLATNNVTWRENVAKGKAGHHKQYRGKPTVFFKLAKAAGLDPVKVIMPMTPPPKAALKKIEAIKPASSKTTKEVKTVPKNKPTKAAAKKGGKAAAKKTAKKNPSLDPKVVDRLNKSIASKRPAAKKAAKRPAAKKAPAPAGAPRAPARNAEDFNADVGKTPRGTGLVTAPATKSAAAVASEREVAVNMPVQERLHALDTASSAPF